MKKYILCSIAAVLAVFVSCQKSPVSNAGGEGTLSFNTFALELDETVVTKAVAASGNYTVTILDADGRTYLSKTYSEIKNNNNKISLPAGNYTLVASSSDEAVPYAAFEQPVYGVTREFSITAGEVTEVGELTCTLLQCKATVTYSDDFLTHVTGPCTTKVSLKAGYPLEYLIAADGTYTQDAGYFAVEGNTLEVLFQGNVDGQNKKMTASVKNVAAREWHRIKFIMKENSEGNATFEIAINSLINDSVLNGAVSAEDEDVIGEDPDKPKGDGGITMYPDYIAGCDAEITDLTNILVVPMAADGGRDMAIKLKAEIPNGILRFNVSISTDNDSFAAAAAAAGADDLDLLKEETSQTQAIFKVVPFPHGPSLLGQSAVDFDLSNAQEAILNFPGTHTFTMKVIDQTGCEKSLVVKMIVEE